MVLAAPLQSWGGQAYDNVRPTEMCPTRSGIVGLLAASLGLDKMRCAEIEALNESVELVVCAPFGSEPHVHKNFQTVGNVRTTLTGSDPGKTKTEMTYRYYLAGARFEVLVFEKEGGKYGLDRIAEALRRPAYMLWLGRKDCLPAEPVYGGIVEGSSVERMALVCACGFGVVYSERELEATELECDGEMYIRDDKWYDSRGRAYYYSRKVLRYRVRTSDSTTDTEDDADERIYDAD